MINDDATQVPRTQAEKRITCDNQIQAYLHCRRCIEECCSPEVAVGWTEFGLQVWCEHHGLNMINIDFEGAKHPAVLYARKPEGR